VMDKPADFLTRSMEGTHGKQGSRSE
jgi:hypothetical protein